MIDFRFEDLPLTLCAIIVSSIVFIVAFNTNGSNSKNINNTPVARGPWRLPIVGNLFQCIVHYYDRLEYFLELAKQYGDVFRFDAYFVKVTFINTPELVEHVTKTQFKKYDKGFILQSRFNDLLGNGIFNADGVHWKSQRKAAAHMFTMRSIKDTMSVVFATHTTEFLKLMDELTTSGNFFDIQDCFFRFTLDSTGEIAFGHSINSLRQDVPFANAFDQAANATQFRFFNWLWKYTTYLLPSEYKLRRNVTLMNNFCLSLIAERREFIKNGGVATDILSRFIAMKDQDGNGFDDQYLKYVILNIILAGRDTTANALSWTTYLLCKHQSVQQKVFEEVERELKGEKPSFENVKNLTFLDNVVHETLRLYPSVPIEVKTVAEDDVLPTGHEVKKGEGLMFLPYVLNRNPKIYDNPEVFKPERWSEPGFNPSAFANPTFNAGYRLCLGQPMALLEIKMVMAALIQRYVITGRDENLTYNPTLTLPVRNGLHVKLSPRKVK